LKSQPSSLLVNGDPYTVRASVELGLSPVVVHGPKLREWGFIEYPSDVETVFAEDVTSVESVLSALTRARLRDRAFRCVQTSDERALVTAATLGALLGVPSMDPDVAVAFRDKWLQKQAVSAVGLPVARTRVVDDAHHVDPALFDGLTKAVLKPIAGGGTRETSVVRSRRELADAGASLRRGGVTDRTFVLEEFIDGDEWMADGVVADGVVRFLSVAGYAEPSLTSVTNRSVQQIENFDPSIFPGAYDLVRPTVETALAALGLYDGVFHMELFIPESGGAPVFGECAARPGGALIHEMIEYKYGVDLSRAAVAIACGVDTVATVRSRPETVGATFLPNRPGVLLAYPTADEIGRLPGVEYVRLEFPYGSGVNEEWTSSSEGVGQVMLSGRTPEEFRTRRDALIQWFDERLVVVPPRASPAELRSWQELHWPGSVGRFTTFGDNQAHSAPRPG